MDSYKRVRSEPVILQASNIDGLKKELSTILSSIAQRQPRDVTLQSMEIPQSFGGAVPAGEALEALFAYPKAGILSNFFSWLDKSGKDVQIYITLYTSAGSNRTVLQPKDLYREYADTVSIKQRSFASVRLVNSSDKPINFKLGFTYKEVLPDEV